MLSPLSDWKRGFVSFDDYMQIPELVGIITPQVLLVVDQPGGDVMIQPVGREDGAGFMRTRVQVLVPSAGGEDLPHVTPHTPQPSSPCQNIIHLSLYSCSLYMYEY